MKLLKKANGNMPRTEDEKKMMIQRGAEHYGNFLEALGFDWKADPHSEGTPLRVAKAWVNDLIRGSVEDIAEMKSFPNSDEFTGLIGQCHIEVTSICAHHHLPFTGTAHVAYIPGKTKDDMVIGLSKLNRITDHYSRRPNIQESLTKQIHDKVDELCKGNRGVAVQVIAKHNCVKCRGIKQDSTMVTSEMSGYFFTNKMGTRQELFALIEQTRPQ